MCVWGTYIFIRVYLIVYLGFPGGSVVKNPPANVGDAGDRFHPWVSETPWRRKWQPTPVFLPGESHGQRSLRGYSPWSHKNLDTTEHACTHVQLSIPPLYMRTTDTHTHTRPSIHLDTNTCAHIHPFTQTDRQTHMDTHIHMSIMFTHPFIHSCTHIYIHTLTFTLPSSIFRLYRYSPSSIYIDTSSMYIDTHTHTNIFIHPSSHQDTYTHIEPSIHPPIHHPFIHLGTVTHTHIHPFIHVNTHIHTHTHIHSCTHTPFSLKTSS